MWVLDYNRYLGTLCVLHDWLIVCSVTMRDLITCEPAGARWERGGLVVSWLGCVGLAGGGL